MTSKKGILMGLAAALAIIAYCTIGMAAENWVMRYVQRTLHYAPAAVFRVVYALAGALLIRIGWEFAKGKRPRGGLTIAPAAVWALAVLAVFAAGGVEPHLPDLPVDGSPVLREIQIIKSVLTDSVSTLLCCGKGQTGSGLVNGVLFQSGISPRRCDHFLAVDDPGTGDLDDLGGARQVHPVDHCILGEVLEGIIPGAVEHKIDVFPALVAVGDQAGTHLIFAPMVEKFCQTEGTARLIIGLDNGKYILGVDVQGLFLFFLE